MKTKWIVAYVFEKQISTSRTFDNLIDAQDYLKNVLACSKDMKYTLARLISLY